MSKEAEKSESPSNSSQTGISSVNAGQNTSASASITSPNMQRWLGETPDQGPWTALSRVGEQLTSASSNTTMHVDKGNGKYAQEGDKGAVPRELLTLPRLPG